MLELDKGSKDSAVPGLDRGDAYDKVVPLPSLEEQRTIADFLDAMDAKITRFIAARRRMIALLEEQKGAIINQAVTRGLDPDVPLKPSGIDWLGDIPAHWEVRRLKALLSQPLQYGAIESGYDLDPSLPRYIRITDIANDNVLRSETAKSLPWLTAKPYLLCDGDILFARSGATSGKAFLYRATLGPAAYAGYLIRARMGPSMRPEFLRLFTHSDPYWTSIRAAAIQATIENVSAEKYAQMPIPVPPRQEQNVIIEKLASIMAPIEEAKIRSRQETTLIQEYRTRLISDVVTGKLDVRGVALSAVEEVAL